MKKTLLLTLFYFISFTSFGQYNKLIDENKLWVLYEHFSDASSISIYPSDRDTYSFLYFKGDSIVEGVKYKVLYKQQFHIEGWRSDRSEPYVDSTLKEPSLGAFLREDTAEQKVYYVEWHTSSNNSERLLYDFSLKVGDSLKNRRIDSIKTVKLFNGEERKKYFFENQYPSFIEEQSVVEGIGGYHGLLRPFCIMGLGFSAYGLTVCFKKDSMNVFGDCDYPSYTTVGLNHFNEEPNSVHVFPNPANHNLTVEVDDHHLDDQIVIKDVSGAVISDARIKQIPFQLDVSALSEGLYFIQISDDGKISKTTKFIKH